MEAFGAEGAECAFAAFFLLDLGAGSYVSAGLVLSVLLCSAGLRVLWLYWKWGTAWGLGCG